MSYYNKEEKNSRIVGELDPINTYQTSTSGDGENKNYLRRFVDSFKPFDFDNFPEYDDDERSVSGYSRSQNGSNFTSPVMSSPMRSPFHPGHPHFDYSRLSELERAAMLTSTSPLSKSLRSRHLSLISLGGAIGTGLFIGSGNSLSSAGPLGLLIVWSFVSSIMFATMSCLAELATAFPVSGAFVTFNTLFIDSSWGFAIAWNYAIQWLVTLPLELVAASITVRYWNTSIDPSIFVAVFYVVIVIINLFGVKGYGEAESLFSLLKIITIIGFTILSIILISGGAGHEFIGGRNWRSPDGGLFNSHSPFKNCCATISTAAFAFAGVELFGLASCETANPKVSIPKAMKHVFWRIILFYISSILMIGLLVSYKSSELLGNDQDAKSTTAGVNINVSPFVIAIHRANIPVLPSIFNAVIIITVLSVGNASVYGSSRTLAALGALRQGPPILNYIDRQGRPLVALCVQFVIGLLGFLVALPGTSRTTDIFDWMLSLSGLSSLFTYFSICLCHLRFRRALSVRARVPEEELVFTANRFCPWYAMTAIVIVLSLQFWAALYPPGNGSKADLESFFQIYLGGPVLVASYIAHKIYAKIFLGVPLTKLWLKAEEIDVDTGRREIDIDALKQEIAEEKQAYKEWPFYRKVYNFFC